MIRAASYARYSTANQSDGSIADQQRVCREYAKLHGIELVQELADKGISGASFGNRPAARELERAALNGDIDMIMFVDLSRLSRSLSDLPKYIERMRYRKIRVVGVQDGFDSDSRSARMQAGMSGIMSDEFRRGISDRTHSALQMRAKEARPTGGKVFGYTGKREKVADQVRTVQEIFRRYAAGADSMQKIVHDFNKRGVPSPGQRADGRWIVNSIRAMLTNEFYIGRMIWNRTVGIKDPDTGIKKNVKRPKSEWIITERPDLAIIDRKTFNTVRARLGRRTSACGARGGGKARFPLSGLLKCGECGGNLFIMGATVSTKAGPRKNKRYYGCSTNFHAPNQCSNKRRLPLALAEDGLIANALAELLSKDQVEQGVKEMRQAMREDTVKPAPAAGSAAIEAKVAKYRALVASGAMDADDAEPVFAKLEAERKALAAAPARKRDGSLVQGPWAIEAAYREEAKRLRDDLQGEDADTAREAFRQVYGPAIRIIPEEIGFTAEVEIPQAGAMLAAAAGGMRFAKSLNNPTPSLTHIPLIPKGRK